MTTITLELPDDLAQQLQQFDTETLSDLLQQMLTHVQPDSPPTIKTLGDLLDQGYGLWADRDDIAEPVEYATYLRSEAWQRHR